MIHPPSFSSPRPALAPAAAFLSALMLGACAAGPDLRYASEDAADRRESGTRLRFATAGKVDFTSSFNCANCIAVPGLGPAYTLTFALATRNRADSSVRLDPLAFRLWPPGKGQTFAAADVKDTRTRQQQEADEAEARGWREEQSVKHGERMASLIIARRGWAEAHLCKTDMAPGRPLGGQVTFVFPGFRLPPDTLVLQWTGPDGKPSDLGRYGRPRVPEDTVRATPFSQRTSRNGW